MASECDADNGGRNLKPTNKCATFVGVRVVLTRYQIVFLSKLPLVKG